MHRLTNIKYLINNGTILEIILWVFQKTLMLKGLSRLRLSISNHKLLVTSRSFEAQSDVTFIWASLHTFLQISESLRLATSSSTTFYTPRPPAMAHSNLRHERWIKRRNRSPASCEKLFRFANEMKTEG
jgi:hypothetical protein